MLQNLRLVSVNILCIALFRINNHACKCIILYLEMCQNVRINKMSRASGNV